MINRKQLYGYHIENGVLTVCPEEAAVVERIATLYLAGASYLTVADTLNREGIPFSPEAPMWNKHKVKRLLENPRYIGADSYPLILDEKVFQAVQVQIRAKTEGYAVKDKRLALRLKGYLRCPCGGALQRLAGKGRRADTLYLKCASCGALTTLPDAELLDEVARQLQAHDEPSEEPYTPSAEVIRLANAIDRGLERPDAPEEVVALILQSASARYDCCPTPIESDSSDHPAVDFKSIGQAVSHITITDEKAITVHFK